jgi:hypothetical protein
MESVPEEERIGSDGKRGRREAEEKERRSGRVRGRETEKAEGR